MQAQLSHFALNGQTLPIEQFDDDLTNGQTSVYEVIKIINSRPVFLSQHMRRLGQSLARAGFDPSWATPVGPTIQQLLGQCPVARHNIRVAVVFKGDAPPRTVVYFIASSYPSAADYRHGVAVATTPAERANPTAKVEQLELRQRTNRMMIERGLFEVLLVNGRGQITEGSRSNLFAVQGGRLITAPDEAVLGGITRNVVLSIAHRSGLPVELRCPHIDELPGMEAMFITGTSPMVLPVRQCGDLQFNAQHPMVANLAQQYAQAEAADIGLA
ncbi:MAG: aminotransferase class IV [Bacteroidales bacterium]|nr:aminotransferase class IV [Bacteroidales bacterium]